MKTESGNLKGVLGGFRLHRGKVEPGQCPECAVKHEPWQAHNQQSLFWQYSFAEKHGRWPTWADAIAHCSLEVQAFWIENLKESGVTVTTEQVAQAIAVKPQVYHPRSDWKP